MKPFRGKPEKPERSNGEIHRQQSWYPCDARCLGFRFRVTPLLRDNSDCVGVHFSPSRTSRPVECSSKTSDGRLSYLRKMLVRQTAGSPTSCSTVVFSVERYRAAENAFRHFGRRISFGMRTQRRFSDCDFPFAGVVLGPALNIRLRMYLSATLLLWVLSGPVLKHGPRSLTCTRVIGTCKPKGEMKVKVDFKSAEGGWFASRCESALPGRL